MKYYHKASLLLALLCSGLFAWAQEKKIEVDIDVDKKDDTWYLQPWVWVVGAAVFILLLVAILKGGKKR